MKPGLMFSVVFLILIVLASAFGLHIQSLEPVRQIPEALAGQALWVCPAADSAWDEISKLLLQFQMQINIIWAFFLMLAIAFGFWAFYQNLLKDEFDRKKYDNAWFLFKLVFWGMIVIAILIHAPNHYRRVQIRGASGDWVLCESNDPAARPVRSGAVSAGL